MTLEEYFRENGITPTEFAPRIGVTAAAVRMWLNGERSPRAAALRKIMEETSGAVMPNDFMASEPAA